MSFEFQVGKVSHDIPDVVSEVRGKKNQVMKITYNKAIKTPDSYIRVKQGTQSALINKAHVIDTLTKTIVKQFEPDEIATADNINVHIEEIKKRLSEALKDITKPEAINKGLNSVKLYYATIHDKVEQARQAALEAAQAKQQEAALAAKVKANPLIRIIQFQSGARTYEHVRHMIFEQNPNQTVTHHIRDFTNSGKHIQITYNYDTISGDGKLQIPQDINAPPSDLKAEKYIKQADFVRETAKAFVDKFTPDELAIHTQEYPKPELKKHCHLIMIAKILDDTINYPNTPLQTDAVNYRNTPLPPDAVIETALDRAERYYSEIKMIAQMAKMAEQVAQQQVTSIQKPAELAPSETATVPAISTMTVGTPPTQIPYFKLDASNFEIDRKTKEVTLKLPDFVSAYQGKASLITFKTPYSDTPEGDATVKIPGSPNDVFIGQKFLIDDLADKILAQFTADDMNTAIGDNEAAKKMKHLLAIRTRLRSEIDTYGQNAFGIGVALARVRAYYASIYEETHPTQKIEAPIKQPIVQASTEILGAGSENVTPGLHCFLNATMQGIRNCTALREFVFSADNKNVTDAEFQAACKKEKRGADENKIIARRIIYHLRNFINVVEGLKENGSPDPSGPQTYWGVGDFQNDLQLIQCHLPKNEQFADSAEHDAQEALSLILDSIGYPKFHVRSEIWLTNKNQGMDLVRSNRGQIVANRHIEPGGLVRTNYENKVVYGGQDRLPATVQPPQPKAVEKLESMSALCYRPIDVPTRKGISLQELVTGQPTVEVIDDANPEQTVPVIEKTILEDKTPPPFLSMSLKRFAYSEAVGRAFKKQTTVPASEKLNVFNNIYRLKAVVVHKGKDIASGHYYTYRSQIENGITKWYQFDDKDVQKVNYADIANDINTNGYNFFYELEPPQEQGKS